MPCLAERWHVLNGLQKQVTTKLKSSLGDCSGRVRITFAANVLYFFYFHTRHRYSKIRYIRISFGHWQKQPTIFQWFQISRKVGVNNNNNNIYSFLFCDTYISVAHVLKRLKLYIFFTFIISFENGTATNENKKTVIKNCHLCYGVIWSRGWLI